MNQKVTLTLIVVTTAILALLMIWNPINFSQIFSSQKATNIATVTLAIASIINILILSNQGKELKKDFIIDHRPYVFYKTNEINTPFFVPFFGSTNNVGFAFNLFNSGKAIANKVDIQIIESCFVKTDFNDEKKLIKCLSKNDPTPKNNSVGFGE